MNLGLRTIAVAVCALALIAGRAEARQAPVLAPAGVSGLNLSFSWTGTAGASGYRLDAGIAPGSYLVALPLGNVTTFAVSAPAIGTYFVRIVALTGAGEIPSNEIVVVVSSVVAPPDTPTGLSVARNGQGIVVSWTPAGTGGAPSSFRLTADTPVGSIPLNLPTAWFAYTPVPAGNYAFRVAAQNAGGVSADSASVPMTMPVGGACDAPPAPVVSQSIFGGYVTLTWAAVPGVAAYQLTGYQNGNLVGSLTLTGATTRFSILLPESAWRIDVAAVFSCGAQGVATSVTFTIDQSTLKMQPRTPDPAPGTALGSPSYLRSVVEDIAARFPGDLRNSCVEHGGNNRFLFRLVAELRIRDKRWGLNWKRGNFGDMSQDVVAFNFSADPDEGTRKIRAWDVIGGHCGSNPGPNWAEITSPAPPAFGNNAMWTLLPYIQAGYTP